MNDKFVYILLLLWMTSCSEGDIIEDDINFEATLEDCAIDTNFVIFKVSTDGNETISLNFASTNFDLDNPPEDNANQTLELNTTNNLIYRQFDNSIDAEAYFCSSIPPGNIRVIRELISTNGTATISYTTENNVTTRSVVFSNVTFLGTDVEIRQELFELGSYTLPTP
ncbi:hypothetical protein J8281_11440 [Aquimarina sp. U1-2]|uniref:hypothetical protein n=1 Tax=Aquimarina sp. U1-2 TaxID=2823141 RepID=UPI001AED11B6|nr:hypothetical protein [Aquimarina sp. U1-2]MBP2832800.1 hypothetical protein [Aquimarina sp. U1-2]